MNCKETPLVSVIMPVYNGSNFLIDVIQSILDQTHKNLELLILDDFSSDNSVEIIKKFKDKRIKLYTNIKNKGYVRGLNFLFKESKGEFIARNDQDDLSTPKRLENQLKLFKVHNDLGICGGQIETIGESKRRISYPISHNDIRALMIFNSGLHHPTVMFRSSFFNDLKTKIYNEKYVPSEDYFLWSTLSHLHRFMNCDKIILKYRIHDENYSSKTFIKQKQNNKKIRKKYIQKFLSLNINSKQNELLNKIIYNESFNINELNILKQFFFKISNSSHKLIEKDSILVILTFFWFKACFLLAKEYRWYYRLYICLNFKLFTFKVFTNRYLIKKFF